MLIDTPLRDACALLLDIPHRNMTAAFFEKLDVAVVRGAWRRLAVASHPDAARRGGSAAKRDGSMFILTDDQVERILRLQRARKRPIGRYFVEKESMTAAQLTALLLELSRHNARWGKAQER